MRTIVLALVALQISSFGLACEKKEAPHEHAPTAPAEKAPAAAAPAPASQEPAGIEGAERGKPGEPAGQHAAASEHEHSSPHGGQVATTGGGHLELLATRDGSFHVWLLDANLGMRPIEGATASVRVGSGSQVKLAPAGDHLTGKGRRIETDHAKVAVMVTVAGVPEEATFTVHFEEHDGAKGHGGGHDH